MKVKIDFKAAAAMAAVKAAVTLYGETAAKKLEGEAKKDRPWTDRTSAAKNSIQGRFGWKGDGAVITLTGNVDYFVYLELAHDKRYAILKPTIEKYAPEILKGYEKLVK